MNILFLSLIDFSSFEERNIYADLLRTFIRRGHRVCCVSPVEKRRGQATHLVEDGENRILRLRIGNTQKVGLIEKGISTLMIEPLFISGIKRYFSDVTFDLVLYATPPVTFARVIRYIKKRDGAESYLMLKDIFPQNSLDLGLLSRSGWRGLVYRYFKSKERKLYALSDRIGCMSEANRDYLLAHNPNIDPEKVDICPNCIEPTEAEVSPAQKTALREKYGLPADKRIFVYGGNLGKPQDVPFIVRCLEVCKDAGDAYFVIAGSGTDRQVLADYMASERPGHVKLLDMLPREEYQEMVGCCDAGLIFLDHRFTIPNFPSRLLSYMQARLPVLACTDTSTDIGRVIEENGFGLWCESNDAAAFREKVAAMCDEKKTAAMGERAYAALWQLYDVKNAYQTIMRGME